MKQFEAPGKSTMELAIMPPVQDSAVETVSFAAINLSRKNIYIVGYDGYPSTILSEKEMALTIENRTLFADYHAFAGQKLISLTRSLYDELDVVSIYQYI